MQLPIDPYILGLLIGDGSLMHGVHLTTADKEILDSFSDFVKNENLLLHFCVKGVSQAKSDTWRAKRIKKSGPNHIFDIIKDLKLNVRCDYKHVPFIYKTASKQDRLEILAGLLDTDGSYHNGGFDFISKSEILANDVVFLSRSVGLAAYCVSCQKSAYPGHSDTYYRVSVSGNCAIIPNRIPRKKISKKEK